MQQELFPKPEAPVSPVEGMRLKLDRKIDREKPCCSNIAIIHVGKGPHAAELRCAKCGSHRGWLPREATSWLLNFLAFWPEARNDVHVWRDSKRKPGAVPASGDERVQSSRQKDSK
jgi:hypothetical protein